MNRFKLSTLLAVPLALSAASANAQVYVQSTRSEPFVPLASVPGVGPVTALNFLGFGGVPDNEEGLHSNLTLPFTFNFLGAPVTAVSVSTNGWLAMGNVTSNNFSNSAVGNSGAPNSVIFGFWDDLDLVVGSFATVGTAPNRAFVVEWNDFAPFLASASDGGQMQIWLYEGPANRFEFRYGGSLTASYSATMGYEGPNGTPNGAIGTCGASCAAAAFNAVANSVVQVQLAQAPELSGALSGFPRGAFPGASASGQLAIQNQGLDTAPGVVANLYLSTDALFDAGDALVGTVTATVPNGTTNVPVTVTVPGGQATADFFLLARLDPANTFVETNEVDNLVVAAQRFATGYELSATALVVRNTGGVNAGDTLTADLTVTHNGVPLVGALEVALFASSDQLYDANDHPVGAVTVTLTGQNVETVPVSGTLPQLQPGPYYLVARLDPNNLLAEANENNNSFVGPVPFSTGPDFTVGTVTIPAEVTPGGTMSVVTTINSVAVPYSGVVEYRLFASAGNNTLEPTDTNLGTFSVTFAGQANRSDSQTITFPGNLPAGRYFVIASVDPSSRIVEVSETNNNGASASPLANAPDFGASNVALTPATLEVGLTANLAATARSTGAVFTGNVPYRVFLSGDNIYDPGDQAVYNGTVFVPGLSTAAITASFPLRALPGEPQFNPGTYFVILVMDPDRATAEADENNNFSVGAATITLRGADLFVPRISTDPVAFIGLPIEVELTIENDDVADARNFRYAYYLSTNNIIRVTDQQIFLSGSATVAANSSQVFRDTVNLPTFTSTQTLYLGVIVDLYSQVPETSESNNTKVVASPLAIVFPIPNMRAQIVGTATAAAAGEQLAVTRLLLNDGVAPVASFEYRYYLSSNPQISTDDILLGTFQASLGTGEDDYGIDLMNVPSGTQAGNYYLGLLVDPDDLIDEVDEGDNGALGPVVPVYRAAIQFVTDTLPRGTIGVPYEVAISARGGAVPLTYAVQSGTLPRGLTLDAASGILGGTASEEGVFSFTLRASAGTAYADRSFTLRIIAPTVDIAVATPSLPTAVVGRDYHTQLVAVGGTLPYEWVAISRLPTGLSLSSSGVLSGRPETPGSLPITVRVRDNVGSTDSKELVLNAINANAALQIVPRFLPVGIVGDELCPDGDPIIFEAQNGVAPYSWAIVGEAPEGMSLTTDQAGERGHFCGAPTRAGNFPMLVRVQDSTGLFDTSLFIFEVADGTKLAISTFKLPAAQLNTAYDSQTLTAIQGTGPYQWSVVQGWGSLPPGITVSNEGVVSGTPTAAGVYAFVVQVVDSQLRQDVQPLSIEVEEPVTTTGEDSGCSCSNTQEPRGSGNSAWLGLGLVAFVGLRRRRSLGLLAGAVMVMVASPASAQMPVPGTPYQISVTPITYADLPSPTVLFTDVDDGQSPVALPFPIKFYDQQVDSVSFGNNGALVFPSGTTISLTNATPGATATPNQFIAPFWDDQRMFAANSGSIGYQVEGTAPSRTITFEWRRISRFGASGVIKSFQVRFYEGPSGRIDIDYGPITGSATYSATMGMEDETGARPIHFSATNCSPNCTQTDYTNRANTRVMVIQDPGVELVAQGIVGPEFAFLGAVTPINVQVQNLHGASIGPFTVSVVIGTDSDLSNAVVVGSTQISLSPFQSQSLTVDATPPSNLGEGEFYFGLRVDSAGVIPEVNENNNERASPTPTRLILGRPDLAVERVRVNRTSLSAGDPITVYTRVRNVGGEPANNVRMAVMLSSNPVISPQDLELGTFNVTLAPGQTQNATTTVTVPSATNSGAYYFGTFADSNQQIDELNESNNGRATLQAVPIAGGNLAVLTPALPLAYRGVTYVALFTAVGGQASYSWRVSQGSLPQGIGLVGATGELYGRPSRAESQNFTVEVSSGGQVATKSFTLTVSDPAAPLTIVTRAVPPAVVGQEYNFGLVSTGGAQSSTVTFSATALPMGITISPTGTLMGTPVEARTSTVTVTATDGSETTSRDLVLDVRPNANLLINPRVLSTARYGQAYTEQLEASGGLPPITWLLNLGNLPEGLSLSTSGAITGTPTQVGVFRILVEARDSGNGGVAARDINAFELEVQDTEGFSISTTTLPDAYLDQGYDQSIAATGGEAPYTWRVTEGRVPTGLVTSANPTTNEFRIAGQPTEPGVFNFLLAVSDVGGRTTQRAFALRVLEQAPPSTLPTNPDDGCSCNSHPSRGASGLGLSGVLLLVLGLSRRRR